MQCHLLLFVLSNEFVFECYTFTDCYQLLNYHYLLTVNCVLQFLFFQFSFFLHLSTCFAKFQFAQFLFPPVFFFEGFRDIALSAILVYVAKKSTLTKFDVVSDSTLVWLLFRLF